jgi:hypothetical protein
MSLSAMPCHKPSGMSTPVTEEISSVPDRISVITLITNIARNHVAPASRRDVDDQVQADLKAVDACSLFWVSVRARRIQTSGRLKLDSKTARAPRDNHPTVLSAPMRRLN